jgi:creatinine amidohydrolase
MQGLSEELPASGMRTVRFKGVDIPVNRMSRAVSDNGWFGDDHPLDATAAWGQEMIQASADYIDEFIEAFKKVQLPEKVD